MDPDCCDRTPVALRHEHRMPRELSLLNSAHGSRIVRMTKNNKTDAPFQRYIEFIENLE